MLISHVLSVLYEDCVLWKVFKGHENVVIPVGKEMQLMCA